MAPTQKTIIEVLNVIKNDVFLPREKDRKNASGVLTVYSLFEINVPFVLNKLNINKSILEEVLADLHSGGFILDYGFEPREGVVPEKVIIVPPNDFLTRYDAYLDKDYTTIRVDVEHRSVHIGEQKILFSKEKQVEIVREVLLINEKDVCYSELIDRPKKNTITSISKRFKEHGVPFFILVGNQHAMVNPLYLNRFKPQ